MHGIRLAFVTTAVVSAGMAVFVIWGWWTKKQKLQPPSKWRKVGELNDIMVFPIKSLGIIRMKEMECTTLGLRLNWLKDRMLMVIDLKGQFLSARQLPKMINISPEFSDSILTLRAPDMMSISIDLAQLCGKSFRATVWGQAVPARDCGEEVARWLSRFLLQEDAGLRLVYYPLDRPAKEMHKRNVNFFPLLTTMDTGAYADDSSFSLINEASVADLNSRLDEPVMPQNFRMNFVVKSATAYEEDKWDWVKIGDVIFRNVRPCIRCTITTVKPETGIKSAKVEPLKTLKSYRQITNPKIRPTVGDSPVMGILLGLRGPNGIVRIGDTVYVGIPEEEAPSLTSSS
ncbi:MOSC domain-containing protein 1, mitochondrial [Camponotus floridanus]|uniref:MOSC domain-containing protein 1, mitochondrial n=1 Tax=Camponotus floridanus TaxID=104421 RepID=E1ZZ65_CAMFO|nr:mitochondrial amidoxime-reducing component 1 [Camponotus floridanus]EFN73480.1 MOSC domain-containing protein 1, mitochondrial [Camponotus floridanus]